MRKPFFRKQTNAWYVNAKQRNGSTKQVRLSTDEDEAFNIWRAKERLQGSPERIY